MANEKQHLHRLFYSGYRVLSAFVQSGNAKYSLPNIVVKREEEYCQLNKKEG